MNAYQGRTAIVTGAASGIGRATALAYLEQGAAVAAVDYRADTLERLVKEVPPPMRDRIRNVTADVRLSEGVEYVLTETLEAFAGVDILVNAAGIYPSHRLLEMTEENWDAVLDTNLKGPFLMSQAVAGWMVNAGRAGAMVNVTSGAAYRARPGAAHYATSKAGLVMLTQSLAIELAPYGIRVNAVSPGFVEVHSDLNLLSREYVKSIVGTIPLGRAGQPGDIARAVLFLTSEDSRWTTGTVFRVDGGSGAGTIQLPLSRPAQAEGGSS